MFLLIIRLIAIALLLIAPQQLPYDYYTLLRLVVCVAGVILVLDLWPRGQKPWAATFAAIAVLFNPIFPVHLTKAVWVVIDYAAAGVFGASFIAAKKSREGAHG